MARSKLLEGLAVVLALLGFSRAASASPEDMFGYGTRSPAMGGTGAASADGFEAVYTNPALLSRLRARKLTLGWQGATFRLSAEGEGLPGPISYAPSKGIMIGVGLPLPFGGRLADRVGVAIGIYTPTKVLVRGRILYPETPQYSILPDRAQSLAVQLGVGADVGYGFRVGAGFAAIAQIEGSVVVATDSSGRVGSRVEDQLIANYAPIVGLTYDLPLGRPHTWRVGANYRGTLAARFSVEIDGTKLSSLNIPIINIAGLAQYDPAQVALEVAYDTAPFVFAFGATYKRWSAYPGPLEPTIHCDGGGSDCAALVPAPVDFHDTVVLRVGADRAIPVTSSLLAHVRGGYFLEPTPTTASPSPSQAYDPVSKGLVTVPTRYFDATRHVLTLGAGLELSRPLPPITLDVYGQLHVLQPRTMTLSPGPSGDVATHSDARLSGTVLVAGMLLGVRF